MNRRQLLISAFSMSLALSLSASTFTPFETGESTGTIGDVRTSFLTEVQFQNEMGSGWILCDGRDVTGSVYHSITGNTSAPDTRGRVLRAKDNGASVNPDGEIALSATQEDQVAQHTHNSPYQYYNGNSGPRGASGNDAAGAPQATSSFGGNETRMKNITVNHFCKIN